MKATGIVRKIDELGRIVIPKDLRRSHHLTDSEDALEIYTEGEMIILRKYQNGCFFCNETDGLKQIGNKSVCPDCLKEAFE